MSTVKTKLFLEDYLNKSVQVLTVDGRFLYGVLNSFDQTTNLVLSSCQERITSSQETLSIPLGVYLVRGDSLVAVSEFEEIDFDSLKSVHKVTVI